MAKNTVEVDVKVDDKGTTKKVGLEAKKTAENLDKTGKSAHTADRNLKGAGQQSANTTKNFSKMAQGMGGLVAVYAQFAAQVFAVSAAFQFLKSAFDTANLLAGQQALGAVTGVAYKTITNSLIEATGGQLAYAEAAKAAAIGTAAGLSPSQLERLGKAAKNTSQALGRDLTDSFNRLVRGVTKAEPELLDELGIILRLETAKKNYAAQIGKTAQSLTQFEQSQAIANEVLTQAEQKFGAIEKIMDPAGTSLNKFLVSFDKVINSIKSGLTSGLAPVFDFLSENTVALMGLLISFGTMFLSAVLPNFSKMADGAKESLGKQEQYLEGLSKKLKGAELDVKNLNKSQKEMRQDAIKASRKTLKAGGMDLTPSKSGMTGADFLLGKSDSAKAAMNADKILKGAERQIETHGKVVTGKLKGFNAQQVLDLRNSYNQRKALLTEYGIKEASMLKRAEVNWKVYSTKAKIAIGTLKAYAITATQTMASGMNKAMKAAGWIGAILMIIDLLKMGKEFFFPVSKEAKQANEATSSYVDTLEGLNVELKKMEEVRFNTEVNFGLQEMAVQAAKASVSADALNKTIEFNKLDKGTDKYKEAKQELISLFTTLSKISPEYEQFLTQLSETGKVDLKVLSAVQETFAEFLQASTALPESLKAISTELNKLAGGAKVDPFAPLIASISKAKTQSATVVEGLKRELTSLPAQIAKKQAELDRKYTKENTKKYRRRGKDISRDPNAPERIVIPEFEEEYKAGRKEIEAMEKKMDGFTKEQKAAIAQQQYLNTLYNEFSKVQLTSTNNQLLANALREDTAKKMTLGITAAQKIANIELKSNERQAKRLEMDNKILAAQASLNAANKADTDDKADKIAAAQAALDNANSESVILDHNNKLEEEKDKIQKIQINNQLEILRLKRIESAIEQDINRTKLEGTRIKSGAYSFGFEQASQASANQLRQLQDERKAAVANFITASTNFGNAALAENPVQAEVDSADNAVRSAEARIAAVDQEIELYNNRGNVMLNAIAAENELTAARTAALSLNPVEQAYNMALIEAKQKAIPLSEEQKLRLYEELEAQRALQEMYELKQGVFDSLTSNITSAFTALVDGTKTAKQAFADMAVAILKDIAQMITRMLVMRAIMAMFPGLSPVAPAGRYGGVFSGGEKAPGYRYGGISKAPEMAVGGVLKGPDAGYPVIMHGTEAVVPLPNGRSIPVEMKGGGQNNNVVVNVSVDSQGRGQTTTESQSGADAGNLGQAIAKAVQQELQNQKRSGGILNPYGVA